eukprot:6208969-Pleurochrysis_carterae.AAC.1
MHTQTHTRARAHTHTHTHVHTHTQTAAQADTHERADEHSIRPSVHRVYLQRSAPAQHSAARRARCMQRRAAPRGSHRS